MQFVEGRWAGDDLTQRVRYAARSIPACLALRSTDISLLPPLLTAAAAEIAARRDACFGSLWLGSGSAIPHPYRFRAPENITALLPDLLRARLACALAPSLQCATLDRSSLASRPLSSPDPARRSSLARPAHQEQFALCAYKSRARSRSAKSDDLGASLAFPFPFTRLNPGEAAANLTQGGSRSSFLYKFSFSGMASQYLSSLPGGTMPHSANPQLPPPPSLATSGPSPRRGYQSPSETHRQHVARGAQAYHELDPVARRTSNQSVHGQQDHALPLRRLQLPRTTDASQQWIKCSSCSELVELEDLGDHVCQAGRNLRALRVDVSIETRQRHGDGAAPRSATLRVTNPDDDEQRACTSIFLEDVRGSEG